MSQPEMMMSDAVVLSPQQRYQQALTSGQFAPDEAQAQAVAALDQVWQQLVNRYRSSKKAFGRFRRPAQVDGVYMWGGVGRGKTWLMDQFFDSIPFRRKMRMHFHHFMQHVHRELITLTGQRDPLDTVADQIYREAVVICFDEFFVTNVTDAMLLSDLFQKLFQRGITLVATSNIVPEGLYLNGIHRDRFLPTIALIQQHCQVLNVDSGTDYRLRVLKQSALFQSPLTPETDRWLSDSFYQLSQGQPISQDPIIINQRPVQPMAASHDVLWCEFTELCLRPRSPADFIEIANRYNTVLVADVPHLNDVLSDGTRRFIYLVDEFYDRRVKLLLTSADPIMQLYQGRQLAFEIERTRSRLLEMQSQEYLDAPHRGDGPGSATA